MPEYNGETPLAPSEYYEFSGWSPTVSKVVSDIIYIAQFTEREVEKYTVTWKNYDEGILETDYNVLKGTLPEYNGEEPVKPGNDQYTYKFIGWTPEITEVKGDITYKATFQSSIFKFLGTNQLIVEGLVDKDHSGMLEVPSVFLGKPVITIAANAFSGVKFATGLIIPSSVTSIGESAFAGMTNLTGLVVPFVGTSLAATGENGNKLLGYFFGTTSVTGTTATKQYYSTSSFRTSYIPNSLQKVAVIAGDIPYNSFSNCKNITTVVLMDTKKIEQEAFAMCSSLKTITFGNSLEEIGTRSFLSTALEKVNIPNTVTKINDRAFANNTKLFEFKAMNENDLLYNVGNYIFSGCNALKTLAIPVYAHVGQLFDNTEVVGASLVNGYYMSPVLTNVTSTGGILSEGSFENTIIHTLTITERVIMIMDAALKGMSKLQSLTIPYVGLTLEATGEEKVFGFIFGKPYIQIRIWWISGTRQFSMHGAIFQIH